MTDLHIHTKFSFDGREEIENYIQHAIKIGDKRIGFSEHAEIKSFCEEERVRAINEVKETYAKVKPIIEKYQDKIEILHGVEFGFSKSSQSIFKEMADSVPFDYIINSVHNLDGDEDYYYGKPFKHKETYGNREKCEVYTEYLNYILDSVKADYDYQIVGHIGYASRYAPYEDRNIYVKDFEEIYTEIFKYMIENGKALELNSSVKNLDQQQLPRRDVIEKYIALGGKMFTFGSDAHDLIRLHESQDAVKKLLLSYGIKEIYYFKNRRPIAEKL